MLPELKRSLKSFQEKHNSFLTHSASSAIIESSRRLSPGCDNNKPGDALKNMNTSYLALANAKLALNGEKLIPAAPYKGRPHGISIVKISDGSFCQSMHSRHRRSIGAVIKAIALEW